ncbi:hypothetical protein MAR_028675 [Mya arenaria]|uniref:BZIP domain-containing protein n=1 Tax=Mya arenaria TaxID=6604 RepID=A0ABY7DH08_MYAAR|nr:hypothetical protein MAR_028675 [Mya arenaria]
MTPEEMVKDDLRKKRNRQSAEKSRKKRIAREKLLEKKIKTHGSKCELRNRVGNGGASGESPSPSGLKRGSSGVPAGGEPSPKVSRCSDSSESSYSRSFLRTSSASCTNRSFTEIAQQSTVSNVSSSSFPLLNSQRLATAISAIASETPSIARQQTWPATINTTSAIANSNPSVSLPVVTSPPPYPGITRQQTTTEHSSNVSKSPEEEKEAIRVIRESLLNGFASSR